MSGEAFACALRKASTEDIVPFAKGKTRLGERGDGCFGKGDANRSPSARREGRAGRSRDSEGWSLASNEGRARDLNLGAAERARIVARLASAGSHTRSRRNLVGRETQLGDVFE